MPYTPLCHRDCCCAGGRLPEGENLRCLVLKRATATLQRIFGYGNFKPGQLEAVSGALHGKDVFVRMATGAGKSLAMFLVPLSYSPEAVGVIISPLNSLMDEQIMKLKRLGVCAIRASDTCVHAYPDVAMGKYRFVMISPELLGKCPWRDLFSTEYYRKNLVLVAVDEAHCIFEWGPKFRKAYERIGSIRSLTQAPFMALTASAPHSTTTHIHRSLCFSNPTTISHNLDRPNICLTVGKKSAVVKDMTGLGTLLRRTSEAKSFPRTVIFCTQKNMVSNIFEYLRHCAKHNSFVAMYHASLSEASKAEIYDKFSNSQSNICCLVATVAFGMGVDISNIRNVCVYGLPESISQLYQLIGRAGRDGNPSSAHVMTNARELKKASDAELIKLISSKENCRRNTLIRALGSDEVIEKVPSNKCCDVCTVTATPTVFKPTQSTIRKPRRLIARTVTKGQEEGLKQLLVTERVKIFSSSDAHKMLGKEVVLPTASILEIVRQSKYINSATDIASIAGLRRNLVEQVYNVFVSFFSTT